MATVTEIAPNVCRISTCESQYNFQFNQFLASVTKTMALPPKHRNAILLAVILFLGAIIEMERLSELVN